MSFDKFFYTYVTVLFFLVTIIGLGAGDIFGESISGLEPPIPVPPDATQPILNFINSLTYFVANLGFFFVLMTVDTGVFLFGSLISAPAIVMIFREVLKLMRGSS